MNNGYERLKCRIDFWGACIGLVVFSPVFLLVPLLVKLTSKGPVFFKRHVSGRDGMPFAAYKFRTMVNDADDILEKNPSLSSRFLEHFKLKDDPRVTAIGYYLRKYSIDEIPQLINVAMGQMSLVGPRMMTAVELQRCGKWRQTVLSVKPGMSGLWQVSGRQEIPFEDRIQFDVHYVRNRSLLMDVDILARTVLVVLSGRGAY